ncbi:unnamed protein product [Cuscuta campestris]|uniref:F-box domain-containing protein n=1 Tax=Cuscuta campestris TaxID=132261 RepID=A0A484KG00_9ASTE|nr:unnamed protein product [Cuscuta campestris]
MVMMRITEKKQQVERDVLLLPEDMMMLILSKLPRKSLIRFKCVSRAWFHLICTVFRQYYPNKSSPCHLMIVSQHQQSHRIHRFSLIHLPKEAKEETSLPPLPDVFDLKLPFFLCRPHPGKKILSSNGLVCFFFNEDVRNYAFNPITRHILKLPHIPYHTCNASFNAGFGYLPRRDEHKIVVWFVRDDLKMSHAAWGCWVLSLKKSINGTITVVESWRRLAVDLPPDAASFSDSFCVNGTIYWLCSYANEGTSRKQHLLLSFDLDEEAFQLRPRPSFPLTAKMVEIEGSLCVGELGFCDGHYFVLWEFKNGDYWVVKHEVNDFFGLGHRRRRLSFLACTRSKSGARQLAFMGDDDRGHGRRLLSYNLQSQILQRSSENLQPLLGDDGLYFLF